MFNVCDYVSATRELQNTQQTAAVIWEETSLKRKLGLYCPLLDTQAKEYFCILLEEIE